MGMGYLYRYIHHILGLGSGIRSVSSGHDDNITFVIRGLQYDTAHHRRHHLHRVSILRDTTRHEISVTSQKGRSEMQQLYRGYMSPTPSFPEKKL